MRKRITYIYGEDIAPRQREEQGQRPRGGKELGVEPEKAGEVPRPSKRGREGQKVR